MNIGALVMMLFGCITIWGGLFLALGIALEVENEKSKSLNCNNDTKKK
jgi:hypothetical protein